MALTGHCFFCGDATTDWDYIGNRKVDLCNKRECATDLRDSNRAADDAAMLDAIDDNYERYR